ncbi:unnamed protein product [Euphydryas editha]|uniref:ZAD domain-containing protein n=1 Tax=Euphydryas editha TaxID=104508 RepID=A0AAU9UKZ7_EUPED|nr:unnamed protein product [Euphydryas editha]
MNPTCFICNIRTGPSSRNATNLFGDDLQLNSGKPLCAVIGDIVEKKIKEEGVYTHVICKKCQKAVVEYDSLQVRLQAIKEELVDQFKKTLTKHNLTYDTFNKEITINTPIRRNEAKKLVLPASKLQPLPPDFMIKSGQWPMSKSIVVPMTKPVMTIPSSSTLKVTVGSSVLTQSVNTNTIVNKKMQLANQTVDPKLIMTSKIEKINPSKSDEILTSSNLISSNQISTTLTFTQPVSTNTSVSSKSAPILSFNVNSLPKDYLSSAILTKLEDLDVEKLKKTVSIEVNNLEHTDEQTMEIDEDCSLTVLSTNESETKLIYEDDIKEEVGEGEGKKESFLDVRMLNAQGRYVVGKLQLLRGEEGEGEQGGGEQGERECTVLSGGGGGRRAG